GRPVLREAQAVPERRLLFRYRPTRHRHSDLTVHGHLRAGPHGGLDRAMERNACRSRLQDRPSAPAVQRFGIARRQEVKRRESRAFCLDARHGACNEKRQTGFHPSGVLLCCARRRSRWSYANKWKTYNWLAEKVSQSRMLPLSKPRWNQRMRCAALPCVNESGTILPWCWRWSVSSPTALAAFRACS